MTGIPLRQRSSTEIVDAAFQIYRREPAQFVLATALIYVPWLLVQLVFAPGVMGRVNPSITGTLVLAIGGILVSGLVVGVVTVMASDVYLGNPIDLARSFRTVVNRLGPLLAAQIASWLLIGIAAIFLIVPGIYCYTRWFAVIQTAVLEKKSAGEAMSRSAELSVDLKWHILVTSVLIFLVLLAVEIGILAVGTKLPFALRQTLSTIVASIVGPFLGITQTLLYYDTRIRKEGFDVEYLASGAWPGAVDPSPSV